MTKPCNFPDRVNTRRIRALKRLETQLNRRPRTELMGRVRTYFQASDEADALVLAIVSSARAVQTKKFRGVRHS